MLASAELAIQIANTKAFIAANAELITLIPRAMQKDGRGARLVDLPPRAPQSMRLIDQSTARNTIPGKVQTLDGVERLVDFILLALPTHAVALYDYWLDDKGRTLEVAEIYPSNQYEIRAAVVRRA